MSSADAIEHLYALSGEFASAAAGSPRRKFDVDHVRVLALRWATRRSGSRPR